MCSTNFCFFRLINPVCELACRTSPCRRTRRGHSTRNSFEIRLIVNVPSLHAFQVAGPSMLPTMEATGELVLENRLIGRFFPECLTRGDLVTFVSPLDPKRVVCKRILGLPGDIVCVDPTGELAPSSEHVVIPKGHLWFSGDNAAWSR